MIRNPALICLCVFVCIPACASGQTAPAAAAPMTTIRTSSDLVVVDVVASDSQQNPVHKLTAADFTLLEDGKPQTVKSSRNMRPTHPRPCRRFPNSIPASSQTIRLRPRMALSISCSSTS